MTNPQACLAPDQVQEAFLAAPPLVAQQIVDLTVKHPSFLRDLFQVEEWPRGQGTLMQQLVFRGAMPQIERGFDKWKKIENNTGCQPCAGPDCSYNITPFGGNAFERHITELMSREFRSPSYCVAEIQTQKDFLEVFGKVVENLYAQVAFFKEFNIGQNFLTSLAKKYVVDSGGAKPNPANPYVYRNIGTTILSTLSIEMLEFFYEQMRRRSDVVPYDVVDGAPIYSLMASHQLLAHLYRDDPNLRQDVRFSSLANDMLMKYNFMSTIRGMFIAAPILYPRRFNAVLGEPVEVLPFVNDIPGEVGTYTDNNPAYEAAQYEEIILNGKWPFKIFTLPTETSLGMNTSFGPEYSFMNNWSWINPLTECDFFRRKGFFATGAKIGLSQQFSQGIYSILVTRPQQNSMARFLPADVCPPTPVVCNNEVPPVSCPCPIITSVFPNPIVPGQYFFNFSIAISAVVTDPIQLGLESGGYITGIVAAVANGGLTLAITLPAGVSPEVCNKFTAVFCDDTLGCSADVIDFSDCRSAATDAVKVTLDRPIKAVVAGQDVLAYFGDGTTATLDVILADMSKNEWTLAYATGFGPTDNPTGAGGPPPTNSPLNYDMCCDRGGIVRICVPPTTDATCPACGPTVTPCVDD